MKEGCLSGCGRGGGGGVEAMKVSSFLRGAETSHEEEREKLCILAKINSGFV